MAFSIDTAGLARALSELGRGGLSAAERAAERAAAAMEEEARRAAPWRDHTGNARQSIRGFSGRAGNRLRCGVSAGAPYSAYLELGREGRTAVLRPTVEAGARGVCEQIAREIEAEIKAEIGRGTS